jgi:hypothetical protein
MDETILFNRVSHGQSPREGSKCCSAGLPLPSALERPPVVHLIVKHGRKKKGIEFQLVRNHSFETVSHFFIKGL